MIPQLIKVRDEFNRWLAPKYGDKLCIDFDFTAIAELQEESEKIVDQMTKAWWLTPNEKREAMSYGMVEDNIPLDDYYVPANLLPLGAGGDSLEFESQPVKEEPKEEEVVADDEKKEALSGDLFFTPEEAENRAKQMGCEGSHTHEMDGATYYMPCKTHEDYEALLKKRVEVSEVRMLT